MIRLAPLLLALGLLAISSVRAGDKPAATASTYVTAVSGVVCQECKAKVTYAVKKLPGVTEITFSKGAKPGEQKVTFASTAGSLEKKDLVQALGTSASEFQILSLDKVKP